MNAEKKPLVPLVTKCPNCGLEEDLGLLVEPDWKSENIESCKLFRRCGNGHEFALDRANSYTDLSGLALRIGEKIKQARRAKSLTQTTLGLKIGLSAGEIGRYESGEAKPTEVKLREIADALGVSVDSLRNP